MKTSLLATAILGGGGLGGNLFLTSSPLAAQAAVVNLPRCEGGQGDGCDAMSEGNEFVKKLQERSAKNYVGIP